MHQQILFHLYVSLLCLYCVSLLVGQNLTFGRRIIDNMLHYFVLTSLAWFAVEAEGVYISALMMGARAPQRYMGVASVVSWCKLLDLLFDLQC